MNFLRKATVNPLDGQPQIVFYPQPDFLNKLLIPATGRNTSKKQQTFKKTTGVFGTELLPASGCWHAHHALSTFLRFQYVRLLISSCTRFSVKHDYCVCQFKYLSYQEKKHTAP